MWTVASTISMTVNVIVVVLLLLLLKFFPISTVKTTVQNIVIGSIIIIAVGIDQLKRSRA